MDTIDSSLGGFYRKFTPQQKLTFFVCLLGGLLAHSMGLFVKFSFHDDAVAMFGVGTTLTLGRWMLFYAEYLEPLLLNESQYSLSLFNGLLSLLFIALTACIIVTTLEIRSKTLCSIIGLSMAVFPTVTGLFGYMFTSTYYMFSLLLGVWGASLICKHGNLLSAIAGTICMALTMGFYQAYVPFIICFFLLYMIHITYGRENTDVSFILRRALVILPSVIASLGLYLLLTNLICASTGVELSDYKGLDNFGAAPVSDYVHRVIDCYVRFLFPSHSYVTYPVSYGTYKLYRCTVLVAGLFGIWAVVQLFRKDKIKALFLAILGALTPLAVNFIFVMVEADGVSILMDYANVFPCILLCYFLDHVTLPRSILSDTFRGYCVVLLAAVCFLNIRFANQCYLKMTLLQQEITSYYNVMISRIESTPGYSDEMPVAFISSSYLEDISDYGIRDNTVQDILYLDNIKIDPYYDLTRSLNTYSMMEYLNLWNAYTPEYADQEEFINLPDVQQMPRYPKDGSIRIIDGTIVVKFS